MEWKLISLWRYQVAFDRLIDSAVSSEPAFLALHKNQKNHDLLY